ncbi:carbon-nitrogen hydrolase family protein [Streptomyces benahoarensis]|uniref:Carbon-nitrogen hydrolase family protein n=1 Tax=Streptomyces benahoarensis TaxID=2595054 RepID=A0A553ZNU2_9ACTN|nr:carbon-nitrogen hydrolase family protein [Streptomyces benahoarensis]TSB26596.1 carbon-nitrogen hydrolase family protein [Streptomyces benahoarensis]TSB43137.1 carbon-nitrogen hydrolase family protein [Streptomyces benahoarensis]
MRIALCQMTSTDNPWQNLVLLTEHVRRAADDGARLAVLPEAAMCRFGVLLGPVAQPLDGPWADGVRGAAQTAGITVVAGMFTPAPGGRVANTLLATGPGVADSYDKIHLYDAFGFRESETVAAGDRVVTIDVDDVRVGLATCYDLRFPELFRAHADAGATVSVLPASWGAGPGKRDQWELLVRARALDATVWLAAVGQSAPDPAADPEHPTKAPTGIGHSMLVAPDGAVRARLGAEPGTVTAAVDAAETIRVRRAVAVLDNRRLRDGGIA